MLNQYFGSFLLNRGYITHDKLNEILSQDKQTRIKIGTLAISSGLLTAYQVEEIHSIQRTQDKRFGEIAIELGYIKDWELESLLQQQKSSQIELGQILIDEGIITFQQLEDAIKEYKQETNLSDLQFQAIESGNLEKLVEAFVNMPNSTLKQELIDYIGLFLRNIVRFIDSSPIFEMEESLKVESDDIVVHQAIEGQFKLDTYLVMPEDVFVTFAARFAEMNITMRDDLANAAVTEFLNLHNGIFMVNMSEKQKQLDLLPPTIVKNSDVSMSEFKVVCSVDVDLGVFKLVLSY